MRSHADITSRRPAHPGRGRATAGHARPAFSLAEIMIAIGILGVGMLMVAATFPVGLDQSRIVSEQTIAPLVANDAFERLSLLLDEPDSFKRIADDITKPNVNPANWLSFRGALRRVAAWQGAGTIPIGVVRSHLPGANAVDDPALPSFTGPYKWTGLNELLVAPYIGPAAPGSPPQNGGAGTRFYPSVGSSPGAANKWPLPLRTNAAGQPILVEPPYTWSALYRVYSTGSGMVPSHYVQFFVFVNRRGAGWPTDWPQPIQFNAKTGAVLAPPSPLVEFSPSAANNQTLSGFSEGAYLLRQDGQIMRIKEVHRSASSDSHRITLDQDAVPNGFPPDPVFWYVPADATTGRSPCIAVYSRTFPL